MAPSAAMNLPNLPPHVTILNAIIADIPLSSRPARFSPIDVLSRFAPNLSRKAYISKLSSIPKNTLLATLEHLDVRYYNKKLDLARVGGQDKKVIAELIYYKVKSVLPLRCPDCNTFYTIPLRDDKLSRRNFCFACGCSSHDCSSPPNPP